MQPSTRARFAADSSSVMASIVRFCRKTYALDYIGFAVLLTVYLTTSAFVLPFHRLFRLDDATRQYPHALAERVPIGMLFLYSTGIPFAVILIALIVFRAPKHKFHVSLLGLAISLVLASSLTNLAKNGIGRPRPDLLDRCKARPGTPQSSLVSIDVCTETNAHTLQDGWRSFPSGHSSFAFSGLGYLALWGAGQLHVFRPHANLLRALLCLLPILAAAGIAISRLEDYRHDAYDISAGSLLGFAVAYVSYRRYFPKLRSGLCDSPIPRRTDSMPLKQLDEETAVHQDTGEFELADEEGSDQFPLNGTA